MAGDTLAALGSLRLRPRGATQPERMDAFYGPIARDYDRLRVVLLQGRERLARLLPLRPGLEIADLGCGTGWLCALLGDRLRDCRALHLVDCSAAMLAVARRRVAVSGPPQAQLHLADAATWRAPRPLDLAVCSYALSMVPDWRACLDNLLHQLRPGGHLALVDFYVSSARPPPGHRRHPAWMRRLWPPLFRCDGVHLRPALLPELERRFATVHREEALSRLPLLRLPRPVLLYLGRKPDQAVAAAGADQLSASHV